MEQQSPKISGNFKGAALGATIAMLPMALILLLIALKIIKNPSDELGKIFVVLQFIGCLICAGSLLGCITQAKRLNISGSGFGLCIIGILIGGLLQMIFTFSPELLYKVAKLANGETDAILLLLVVSCAIHLPLVFGTALLGRKLPALNSAKVSYSILALYPLILYGLAKIIIKTPSYYDYFGSSSSYESSIKTFYIVSAIVLGLAILISVIAWWGTLSNASELEEDAERDTDNLAPQATYIEQPTAPMQQTAAPQQQNYSPRPVSAITDEQKKILMGMSNQELTNVINNPSLYANPAFVEEAKKTLTKRQGWEIIKDYSDEQLLSIVHDNVQGFSAEVLDAASMELLARENATFINEVSSLTIPELQGILSNADSYYDGYIQLATRVLNERINNPGNAQA